MTLALTGASCLIGTIGAIALVPALNSSRRLVRIPARFLTEFGKAVPILVSLVWLQYVAPSLLGWHLSSFTNASIALSLNLATVFADILRAGLAAIPAGEVDVARVLGMNSVNLFRRVLLPGTVRRTFASAMAMYIGVLKLSTLASMIGVAEVLYRVRILNAEEPHPIELYSALAIASLAVIVPLSLLGTRLERCRSLSLYPKSRG